MAITNYCIIDHVGSLTQEQISPAYDKIYTIAKNDGFEKKFCFTLKAVCQKAWNPYSRTALTQDKLKSMKIAMRYQKNPKHVYFICPTLDYTAERELKKWYERCIDITVYEVDRNRVYKYTTVYDELDYGFHDKRMSINDRIIEMWAPAFGIEYDAPVARIDNELDATNYCKRPDHKALIESGETHYTKPYTNNQRFYQYNCSRLTEEQKRKILEQIEGYINLADCKIDKTLGSSFGSVSGNIELLETLLDLDYTICKDCNRPMRVKLGHGECAHCSTVVEDREWLVPYYEDNYTDEYEDNHIMDDTVIRREITTEDLPFLHERDGFRHDL